MRSGQFCFARQSCLQNFNPSEENELQGDCRNFTRLAIGVRLDEATSRGSIHRGLYVHVHFRRERDGRWSTHRRMTPLGVKLTEGGFTSFHAFHAARLEGLRGTGREFAVC
jgi:hypothetical protein